MVDAMFFRGDVSKSAEALMQLPGVPSESSVAASLAAENGTALRIDHQRFPLETFQTLREMVLQYVEDRGLVTGRLGEHVGSPSYKMLVGF